MVAVCPAVNSPFTNCVPRFVLPVSVSPNMHAFSKRDVWLFSVGIFRFKFNHVEKKKAKGKGKTCCNFMDTSFMLWMNILCKEKESHDQECADSTDGTLAILLALTLFWVVVVHGVGFSFEHKPCHSLKQLVDTLACLG